MNRMIEPNRLIQAALEGPYGIRTPLAPCFPARRAESLSYFQQIATVVRRSGSNRVPCNFGERPRPMSPGPTPSPPRPSAAASQSPPETRERRSGPQASRLTGSGQAGFGGGVTSADGVSGYAPVAARY